MASAAAAKAGAQPPAVLHQRHVEKDGETTEPSDAASTCSSARGASDGRHSHAGSQGLTASAAPSSAPTPALTVQAAPSEAPSDSRSEPPVVCDAASAAADGSDARHSGAHSDDARSDAQSIDSRRSAESSAPQRKAPQSQRTQPPPPRQAATQPPPPATTTTAAAAGGGQQPPPPHRQPAAGGAQHSICVVHPTGQQAWLSYTDGWTKVDMLKREIAQRWRLPNADFSVAVAQPLRPDLPLSTQLSSGAPTPDVLYVLPSRKGGRAPPPPPPAGGGPPPAQLAPSSAPPLPPVAAAVPLTSPVPGVPPGYTTTTTTGPGGSTVIVAHAPPAAQGPVCAAAPALAPQQPAVSPGGYAAAAAACSPGLQQTRLTVHNGMAIEDRLHSAAYHLLKVVGTSRSCTELQRDLEAAISIGLDCTHVFQQVEAHLQELVMHPSANYLVSKCFDLCPRLIDAAAMVLSRNLRSHAQHKHASYVVEAVIEHAHGSVQSKEMIIRELISPHNRHLVASHDNGNFVVQKAIDHCPDDLLPQMCATVQMISCTTHHGQKMQRKLKQRLLRSPHMAHLCGSAAQQLMEAPGSPSSPLDSSMALTVAPDPVPQYYPECYDAHTGLPHPGPSQQPGMYTPQSGPDEGMYTPPSPVYSPLMAPHPDALGHEYQPQPGDGYDPYALMHGDPGAAAHCATGQWAEPMALPHPLPHPAVAAAAPAAQPAHAVACGWKPAGLQQSAEPMAPVAAADDPGRPPGSAGAPPDFQTAGQSWADITDAEE